MTGAYPIKVTFLQQLDEGVFKEWLVCSSFFHELLRALERVLEMEEMNSGPLSD